MNEILRETLCALRSAGFEPRISNAGKHLKVRFTDRQNRKRLIVISRTPGTTFALVKHRALLRRLLRRQGPNGEGVTR
jgi:hypothetical protein